MNPDPMAKLAKFTPAGGADPAELLFAAGRASARTHWGWKAAVAGLFATNLALGAALALRSPGAPATPPATEPPAPIVQPPSLPVPQFQVAPSDEPSSYHVLMGADLEHLPKVEPVSDPIPDRPPLTALAGRRGELD